MAWIMLEDGWRDESSEGPYTETLQTKGRWTIVRLHGEKRFALKNCDVEYALDTVEICKQRAKQLDLEDLGTSELADMADSHNSVAYAALSDADIKESAFRTGLIEILMGAPDTTAADRDALTNAIRTAEVAALVVENGGDLWGVHPKYPKSDWKYEVENGDTMLGYWEWALCKLEEEESEDDSED